MQQILAEGKLGAAGFNASRPCTAPPCVCAGWGHAGGRGGAFARRTAGVGTALLTPTAANPEQCPPRHGTNCAGTACKHCPVSASLPLPPRGPALLTRTREEPLKTSPSSSSQTPRCWQRGQSWVELFPRMQGGLTGGGGPGGCPALWASGAQESLSPAKPLWGRGRGRAGSSGTHSPTGSRFRLPQAGPIPRAASWAPEPSPSVATCASVFGLMLEGAGSVSACTSPLFLPYPT